MEEHTTDPKASRPSTVVLGLLLAIAIIVIAVLIWQLRGTNDSVNVAAETANTNVQQVKENTEEEEITAEESEDAEVTDEEVGDEEVGDEEVGDEEASEPATLGEADEDGIRWYSSWVETDDLGLYTSDDGFTVNYYLIGEQENGKRVVLSQFQTLGTWGARLLEQEDGTFVYLDNYSYASYEDVMSSLDTEKVTSSSEEVIASLETPEVLEVDGVELEKFSTGFDTIPQFVQTVGETELAFVATTEHGDLYEYKAERTVEDSDVTYHSQAYYLRLADNSRANYRIAQEFLADDNSVIATWGSTYADIFSGKTYLSNFLSTGGCGSGGYYELAPASAATDFVEVATTPNGQTLYTITNPDSAVLKASYATYQVGRFADSENVAMSYEDFVAGYPLLIWETPNGYYVGLMDTTYAPLVECGKPVIYLYPETEQQVSVEVGADVTISEPYYGAGWNVVAQPNGQLTLSNGDTYSNLYWEGTGYGNYPEIDFGRIVESAYIEKELVADLQRQGLNKQEIADFMEFWLPRMPKTPYIRLSWFTTAQMNELAPLRVYPMPQTVQRVFLDFEGLDSPYMQLRPQTLESFDRNGFTLVEWGGLLVGGHEK